MASMNHPAAQGKSTSRVIMEVIDWWFMEVIESYRRVILISVLSLISDKGVATGLGILLAVGSTYLYGVGQPYHQASTNTLAVVMSNQVHTRMHTIRTIHTCSMKFLRVLCF